MVNFGFALNVAHDERTNDGHGEVNDGYDQIGFEVAEGSSRRCFSDLGDVSNA
jgi:hypothetical protein